MKTKQALFLVTTFALVSILSSCEFLLEAAALGFFDEGRHHYYFQFRNDSSYVVNVSIGTPDVSESVFTLQRGESKEVDVWEQSDLDYTYTPSDLVKTVRDRDTYWFFNKA